MLRCVVLCCVAMWLCRVVLLLLCVALLWLGLCRVIMSIFEMLCAELSFVGVGVVLCFLLVMLMY